MQALELQEDGAGFRLELVRKPIMQPRPGQVLVRIGAAPIHPSDLMFLRGEYGLKKKLPAVPGFEGSGIVVKSGGGWLAKALVGRRVACGALDDGGGTWAEYMVTTARRCMPLLPGIREEQGATMIVNPLTAWALMDIARRGGHSAVVQTAAAGALGRMILILAKRFGIQVIHIVRRSDQIELLRALGAEYILDSSQAGFDAGLRQVCLRLRATLAFDGVAGEITGRLLCAMPGGSRVLVHGALARQDSPIDPKVFIFEGKRVEGFWASDWYSRRSLLSLLRAGFTVQRLGLASEARQCIPLEQWRAALDEYARGMTQGKFLLVPHAGA
jgi:NADPH:quinone reductase-like Zn-dependent oxidoreductase